MSVFPRAPIASRSAATGGDASRGQVDACDQRRQREEHQPCLERALAQDLLEEEAEHEHLAVEGEVEDQTDRHGARQHPRAEQLEGNGGMGLAALDRDECGHCDGGQERNASMNDLHSLGKRLAVSLGTAAVIACTSMPAHAREIDTH